MSFLDLDDKDKKSTRTRNWAFIMYLDSMPNNDYNTAIRFISAFYIPFAVSPYHDRDVNADGEPKKPHYHVLITADGNKSYSQIKEIADSVHGTEVIPIQSACGYYRYFTHKDNPEKAQYLDIDIHCYNGFDGETYNKPLAIQRYNSIKDMCKYIVDNRILEYSDFVLYCCDSQFEWFKMLCDNSTYIISEFIKSYRNKVKNIPLKESLSDNDSILGPPIDDELLDEDINNAIKKEG